MDETIIVWGHSHQGKMRKELKLTIELVPSSAWWSNVRSKVSQRDWDKIRKWTYKRANYQCEICSGKGDHWPVECHEIWEYDDKNTTQKLNGFIALCPACHNVKHYGLSQITGKGEKSLEHLCKVNNLSKKEALEYIKQAFLTWEKRSQVWWDIDISILEKEWGISYD
jgi:hypothetical protein